MGKTPTGKTGALEYNGAAPVVWTFGALTGVASATGLTPNFVAPFDFKLKEVLFQITDSLAATTANAALQVNGVTKLNISCNGLATGFVDVKAGTAATGFAESDYLIRRGDKLRFRIPAVASFGGQGVIVGNPL